MLLFHFSRLWYCPNYRTNNTEPTPYVHIRDNRVSKYTLWASSVAMFWQLLLNLPDSEKSKQSA